MGFWANLYHRITGQVAAQPVPSSRLIRSYNAAMATRLTSDWVMSPTSERTERRQWLRALRARSRDLSRNDDYVKQFLRLCKSNIIGRGIKLQGQAKTKRGDKPDTGLNNLVEDVFLRWGKKDTCTTSGRLSWTDAQRRFVTTLARDGEVLVRIRHDKMNPFGFALQFIDVSWLDEVYSGRAENGNRIVMSVEIDANERPVAYWLTPPPDLYSDPNVAQAQRWRTRVPAEEIIHEFLPDDSEDDTTTRGLPWTAAAALKIKVLDGYEEAELVAARIGACKGGFLKPPADKQYEGDEPDISIEEVEPGMIQELPPGYSWETYDPTHPNQNYPAFIKACLRSIASGLGVSYNSLANDLEGVNYSSIRHGLQEEREVWRALQQFTIEHFCEPVFKRWIEAAWLSGQLAVELSDLPRIRVKFQAKGWNWIDPAKEISANIEAIQNNLTTRSDVLAQQGEDFEEVVTRLAEEKKILQAAGLWQKPAPPKKPAPDDDDDK